MSTHSTIPAATRRDPFNDSTLRAFTCLQCAHELRVTRRAILNTLYIRYPAASDGPLISGVESYAFPQESQDWLRTNAREIGDAVDTAFTLWTRAGRRAYTLRKAVESARVDGIRY